MKYLSLTQSLKELKEQYIEIATDGMDKKKEDAKEDFKQSLSYVLYLCNTKNFKEKMLNNYKYCIKHFGKSEQYKDYVLKAELEYILSLQLA